MGRASSKLRSPPDGSSLDSDSYKESLNESFETKTTFSSRRQDIGTLSVIKDDLEGRPTSWFEGRRFVTVEGSPYVLPQDNTEYTRQTESHFMNKTLLGTNISAPVEDVLKKGGKVLDIGCSIGTWAIDIAAEYPNSKIIGIDMLPVFPKDTKPANVMFQVINVCNGLPFNDNTFDLIHIRMMITSLRHDDWAPVLAECYRVLGVGGYILICERDFEPWKAGPLFTDFTSRANRAYIARGFDPFVPRRFKTLTENMGFVEYTQNFHSIPCGPWGGEFGRKDQENVKAFIIATKSLLLAAWGITSEDFDELINRAFTELDSYRVYFNLHTVYAKKPELNSD